MGWVTVGMLQRVGHSGEHVRGPSGLQIKLTSDKRAREMYDVEIGSHENIEFLDTVISIAVACLKEEMDERSNIKQVAENL
jgi:hypothetical protein